MPAQPSAREPEEDMETEGDMEVPPHQANGEVEEEEEERHHREERGRGGRRRGRGGGEAEETMEESGEEHESERGSELEETEAEEEEEEESSEMDDEDCERRRSECLDEMSDLEKQFLELKEKLFRERLSQVKVKLEEVLTGKAGEYQDQLGVLQQNLQMRTQVAGIYRELCLQVIKHRHECEMQGARQHLESERTMLYDTMKTELLDKIRRLEEDKQSVDITSEWWSDEGKAKKCKRKNHLLRQERKKKAVLVSGPYIVYMLRDIDILEDWTAIKKAKAAITPLKKKSEGRQPLSVRTEGGTLYYDGEKFSKGNSVLLEVNDDSPAQAVITAVSTGEVWLKRPDGSKTKIYISQLQKGKYVLRKA
ncbi:breast cancer metastasis-suppressor 1 isoform X2 [Engraulis encrasicolus]